MEDAGDLQLHIRGAQGTVSTSEGIASPYRSSHSHSTLKLWRRWFMVIINTFFLLVGQTVATLLGRFYYKEGGNSIWMATIVQSAGFPILLIPLVLYPSPPSSAPTILFPPLKIAGIYLALGLATAADNLMYSYGLFYLPVSTYSLICASQLAFNAVFAYLFNSQKLTHLIFNSVILLTLSATLLGIQSDSEESTDIPKGKYPLGFILTVSASALYSLLLSLIQLAFQKVIKVESFQIVLQMQLYTAFVATCATVVGLFASGEWSSLRKEMTIYETGEVSYLMTLVWTAICWQVASVGIVGLIFLVSSLFSNVVGTVALPIVPIFAVVFFHEKMDGVKIIAMLLSVWGFTSYVYQHYLDEMVKRTIRSRDKERDGESTPSNEVDKAESMVQAQNK